MTSPGTLHRSKLGDEGGVLGRGQAALHGGSQGGAIPGDQRLGVEPEAGEGFGAVESVTVRRPFDEAAVAQDVPEDFVRVEGATTYSRTPARS